MKSIISVENFKTEGVKAVQEAKKRKMKFQLTGYYPLDESEDGSVSFTGNCTREELIQAVSHILSLLKD